MYNQGLRYGAIGYYQEVDVAFDAAQAVKVFHAVAFGERQSMDFTAFNLGFKKAKTQVIKVQKMKAAAEAECNKILSEFENELKSSNISHYTELEGWKADNPNVPKEWIEAEQATAKANWERTKKRLGL